MNIHTQLKMLTLLCIIPLFNAFAAQPALPESLRAELASIDAASDHEIVCKVVRLPQEYSEQILTKIKQKLKEDAFLDSSLAQKDVHARRLLHKYLAIHHELEVCDDPAIKALLQAQQKRIDSEMGAAVKERNKLDQSLIVDRRMPREAYDFELKKLNILDLQTSLLLAQKTKLEREKAQLIAQQQQEKIQWQQREQALLAQLRHYQLLVDGEQIEGMPNVPGGVEQKREHKRRGSF